MLNRQQSLLRDGFTGGIAADLGDRNYTIAQKCEMMEEHLRSSQANPREFFQGTFDSLLRHLVQPSNPSDSWFVLAAKNQADTEALVKLLSPNSVLFDLMLKADSDGLIKYIFPITWLPAHIRKSAESENPGEELRRHPLLRSKVDEYVRTGDLRLRVMEYFLYWFAWFGPRQPKVYYDSPSGYTSALGGSSSSAPYSASPYRGTPSSILDKGREFTNKVLHHHGAQKRLVRPYVQLFARYLEFFCSAGRCAAHKQEGESLLYIIQDYWLTDAPDSLTGSVIGGFGSNLSYSSYRSDPLPPGDLLECMCIYAEYAARSAAGLENGPEGAAEGADAKARGGASSSLNPLSRFASNPFGRGRGGGSVTEMAGASTSGGPPSSAHPLLGFGSPHHVEIFGRLYGLLWRILSQLAMGGSTLANADTAALLSLLRSCCAPWEERMIAAAGRPTSKPSAAPSALPATPARTGAAASPGPQSLSAHAQQAGPCAFSRQHHLQQARLCSPYYSGLIPLFLDVCCDRMRTRPQEGERALREALEALAPLTHAPEVAADVREIEEKIRDPEINTNPNALSPAVHEAFEFRKTWGTWVAAALQAPGGTKEQRPLGDLPRPSIPRLFSVLEFRQDGPPVEGAAFAIAALVNHVHHVAQRKTDDPLAKPAVRDACKRLLEGARRLHLPLTEAMRELQLRLRVADASGEALTADLSWFSEDFGAAGAAPQGAAGAQRGPAEAQSWMAWLTSYVTSMLALGWLASLLGLKTEARAGAEAGPAARGAAVRRRSMEPSSLKQGEAEAIYRGDWERRPIGANEIGFLVVPLLRLSDRLNRDLGLTGDEPEWLRSGEGSKTLRLLLHWLRAKQVKFTLRNLADRAMFGWIIVLLTLWECYRILSAGPLDA